MNLEASSFARCVKHPSQFFTGFCSFCLAERLSNVESIERNPNPNPNPKPQPNPQNEIVEISIDPDRDRSHGEVRVRRTLLSLFQLDDSNGDLEEEKSVSVESKESRSRSGSKRVQIEDGCFNCVIVGKHLERKRSLRHSCDWRACCDDSKDGLERHRHSWDGSMMSKALTCSFAACLDERLDGSLRVRRRVPEETSGSVEASQASDVEKPKSPSSREENRQHSQREIDLPDIGRKKSHRWSRVWDWSITSPFRDFGKKRQHVLDRSMSESWTESRGMAKSGSTVNGKSSIRASSGLSRSVNGAGSQIQKYRPDLSKKREYRFGRSRSVHYPSPRNVDNGLLRFYLTPMRTSRSTNKGRTKTSRLFTKGLLGI